VSTALPTVRYARSGDVDVAYQALGAGPPDVVLVDGAITHLRVMWEEPRYRRFCERLASFARLIRFDKRGMGMSDRVRAGTLEERMDDIRAVLDAVGSERAAMIGISEGGPLSMLFAAAHPERVEALVLLGVEVKEETTEDWPWGEWTREQFEAAMAQVPERWGLGRFVEYMAPSLAGDPWLREWAGRLQVEAGTPGDAERFMRMAFEIDVRDVVPAVQVPTLVIHRTGDRLSHVENGRFLAANIPGARYLELPGDDHVLWVGERADEIPGEIQEFLTGARDAPAPERVLATVLFTDIVGSTERAAELGDRDWADLLRTHHATVRQELARFSGRELDTAGDGFLASFDGPARAIRCGLAAVGSLGAAGIPIRAGVHTGECEVVDGKLGGIAVHIGARVAGAAGPGEVLVSGTVRDLVAGSGIDFEDRGVVALKGVPEPRRLFAVSR
jgi:class 3 adenylate cyclase